MELAQRRAARLATAVAAVVTVLASCYRVTVITGEPAPAPPPVAPTIQPANVIDRPWQHSFVIGLVPPAEISTRERCPQGVAEVVTEHSFLNGLVRSLTYGIYSPIHTRVTCAAQPGSAGAAPPGR